MAYGSESYDGRAQRGGHIQDDSRAFRGEVEEEPTDLDTPESDGLDDDELEDVKTVAGALDDEGGDDEDSEEEAASPLAEDAPIAADEDEEEGVGTGSGSRRGEAAVMSHGDRRRQFPAVAKIPAIGKVKVKTKTTKRAKTAKRPKTARVA